MRRRCEDDPDPDYRLEMAAEHERQRFSPGIYCDGSWSQYAVEHDLPLESPDEDEEEKP